MASNNCFNSPTCSSMTAHFGGIASPAEGVSLVLETIVIAFGWVGKILTISHQTPRPAVTLPWRLRQ
jgi:hypothetical protein